MVLKYDLACRFPSDRNTLALDDQFLWGSALMISPVLAEGIIEREIYFPYDAWYDYYTGEPIEWIGDRMTVQAPADTIPLHIRGGHIIPTQGPAMNTLMSRQEPMGVIVAIGLNRKASGDLFWDDGESQDTVEKTTYSMVQYSFVQDKLTVAVNNTSGRLTGMKLSEFEFLGVELKPESILYNGGTIDSYTYDPATLKLTVNLDHNLITGLELKLNKIWYNTVVV
ncbi:hypothetical protein SK128_000928 [Halocaridina rubra]|uniref:Glycosyl hydrolase family 31 C-terminal domain-containing protein n=1 Tax=Halocaridina rubra TaxID=373956 RepID=A0AAN9A3U5_HALRR